MTNDLAQRAREAAKACDEIGCTETAKALRKLAEEHDALQARNKTSVGAAQGPENLGINPY